MSRKRPSLGGVIKDIAVKLAREAERYVGAEDASPCACEHPRSAHCGCGTHCFGTMDGKGGGKPCECSGFTPKAEG
jgi:hypothetical protein